MSTGHIICEKRFIGSSPTLWARWNVIGKGSPFHTKLNLDLRPNAYPNMMYYCCRGTATRCCMCPSARRTGAIRTCSAIATRATVGASTRTRASPSPARPLKTSTPSARPPSPATGPWKVITRLLTRKLRRKSYIHLYLNERSEVNSTNTFTYMKCRKEKVENVGMLLLTNMKSRKKIFF